MIERCVYCRLQTSIRRPLDHLDRSVMPIPIPPDLTRADCLTLAEAARLLGVKSTTPVRRLIADGALTAYEPILGRALLVERAAVERLAPAGVAA